MSKRTDLLDPWWDGLSASERADALRAAKSGHLDDGTRRSLESAGVLAKDTSPTDDEVITYLKMRH